MCFAYGKNISVLVRGYYATYSSTRAKFKNDDGDLTAFYEAPDLKK